MRWLIFSQSEINLEKKKEEWVFLVKILNLRK